MKRAVLFLIIFVSFTSVFSQTKRKFATDSLRVNDNLIVPGLLTNTGTFNLRDGFIDSVDVRTITGNGGNLTGITGATGGVANVNSTTIGADMDADGVGNLALQTQLKDRIVISPTGGIIIQGMEYWMAVGDSVTAINNAIDAGYSIIHVPPGTYVGTGDTLISIQNRKKFHLIGSGKGKSIIAGGTGQITVFNFVNVDSAIVEGFTFTGDLNSTVHFDTVTSIIFRNNEVNGCITTSRRGDNIKVYSNYFYGNRGGSSAHGFEFFESTNSAFYNNYVFDNQGMGLEIWDSQHISANGNNFGGNRAAIKISGYVITDPPFKSGVGSRHCTVSGNTSLQDTIGILVGGNSALCTISNNTIKNLQINGNGIVFNDNADSMLVSFNTLESTNRYAGNFQIQSVIDENRYTSYIGEGIQSGNLILNPNPTTPKFYTGVIIKNGPTTWTGMNSAGGASNFYAVYTGGGNGIMRFYVSDSTTNNLAAQIYGDGGFTIGEPIGNSKGDKTLNVAGSIYQDGVQLPVNGGTSIGTTQTYGSNDNFGLNLETNNMNRLSFSPGGDATFWNSVIIDASNEAKAMGSFITTSHAQSINSGQLNAVSYGTTTNRAYMVKARFVGINTVNPEVASYELCAAFRNISGTLVQVGSTNVISAIEDDATWNVDISTGSTNIQFRIFGDTTDLCEWQITYIIDTVSR